MGDSVSVDEPLGSIVLGSNRRVANAMAEDGESEKKLEGEQRQQESASTSQPELAPQQAQEAVGSGEGEFATPKERSEPKRRIVAAKTKTGSTDKDKKDGAKKKDGESDSDISSLGERPEPGAATARNLEQELGKEEGPKDVDAARTLFGERESEVDRKVRKEVEKWKVEIATQLEKEKQEFTRMTQELGERNRELERRAFGENEKEKKRGWFQRIKTCKH